MSDITHNDPLVTESKLTEFYNDIKPFLGCPAYVTQEGDEMYFSSEEKVVGRWTDGKPLYQKVIEADLPNYSSDDWHLVGNIGTDVNVVNLQGFVKEKSNNQTWNVDSPRAGFSSLANGNNNIGNISVRLQAGSGAVHIVFIVNYTKSIDSATTTIEQKPTHYSTDEQVVGTWIDGKPIYQRTFSISSITIPAKGSSIYTDITTDTSYKLIEAKGFYTLNNIRFQTGAGVLNDAGNTVNIFSDVMQFDSTSAIRLKMAQNISSSSLTATDIVVTIQYIKTTD